MSLDAIGYIFGNGLKTFHPARLPTKNDVVRLLMKKLEDARNESVQLSPKKKSSIYYEVADAVMAIWTKKKHAVQSRINIWKNVKALAEEITNLRKNLKEDEEWIEATKKQYDKVFDVSQKEKRKSPQAPILGEIISGKRKRKAPNRLIGNDKDITNKISIDESPNVNFFDNPDNLLSAIAEADTDQKDLDYEPDPGDVLDDKTYRDWRPVIGTKKRFQMSIYQTYIFVNTTLVCSGVTHISQLISRKKIELMEERYDKEELEAHKQNIKAIQGLKMDGKKVRELLPHNQRSEGCNFVTWISEPENDFVHLEKCGEAGVEIAAVSCKIIDDTGSKDEVVTTGSDGSANNTSPDVGTHRRIEVHVGRPLHRSICSFHMGGK